MNRPPAAAHDFWVVIPAYNEGATVRDVAARARRYCANVIVVDDGSTDGTVEALAGLDITLLRNEQNRGKADSLWRGLSAGIGTGRGRGHYARCGRPARAGRDPVVHHGGVA